MGVTSQSMLDLHVVLLALSEVIVECNACETHQAPGSAKDDGARGSTHPSLEVLDFRSALTAVTLSRSILERGRYQQAGKSSGCPLGYDEEQCSIPGGSDQEMPALIYNPRSHIKVTSQVPMGI